jgi:diaminohydroxyphosphoribosylaminopyrimidine deaminase/5-amino-6-(5-phosphoribosylamino)uracil reductase
MVGCVIIHNQEIIGEGFHEKHGESHAEVNAINAVKNKTLLKKSTLVVTLEPCAHYGLTPPCSDLIIQNKIPRVIIGTIDPFAEVAGKGIVRMIKAGIDVEVGILENECRELNKRFFTFHEKKRPFIILKWAQTLDGFIDIDRLSEHFGEPTWITGEKALVNVHKLRAEEDAILVGTNTAEKDNPSLTVRHCEGKNPLRLVIDRELRLPKKLNLFDNFAETLVFNAIKNETKEKTTFVQLNFSQNIIPQILTELHKRNQLSVIIEGGRKLLQSFIDLGIWDEAHIYTGNKKFITGICAPIISGKIMVQEKFDSDHLVVLKNEN